jgi:eukaryotic-like serine/threonine-protein kinase
MKICTSCNKNIEDNVSRCPYDNGLLEEDPLINSILDGSYIIQNKIGKGGMGIVYRAQHVSTQEIRAIKVLLPEVSNLPGVKERFFREGKAAQRIHHPNVVKVYDIETSSNGLVYMAMEFIEGHVLSHELKKKGHFSALKALILLEPIIEVLAIAHSSGVVHRDLKPENIMISKASDGSLIVKLLDLGIAKLYSMGDASEAAMEQLTKTGQAIGTPYYMSPEQWGEAPKDAKEGKWQIDGRADLYSLGIMFYEMISGKRPFEGPGLLGLATQHMSFIPPALNELMPDVPQEYAQVIARAMAKDRNDRPSTAEEFGNELRASLGMARVTYAKPIDTQPHLHEEPKKEAIQEKEEDHSSVNRFIGGLLNLFRRP